MARTLHEPSPAARAVERYGRVSAALVDQVLSSGTQFLIAVFIAHAASASVLGAASAVLIVQGLLLGVQRAVVGDIVLLRSRRKGADAASEARTGLLLAGVLATVFALGLAAASVAIGGVTGQLLLVLAFTTPATCAQDLFRAVAYGRRRVGDAVVVDAVWFAVQVVLSGLLFVTSAATAPRLLIAWGLGAAAGAVVGALRTPLSGSGLAHLTTWRRQDGTRARGFLADYAVSSGVVLSSHLLLSLFMSLADYGALRLALMSMTPPANLMAGVRSLALGRLAESEERPHEARAMAQRLACVFGAAMAVYGLTVTLMPARIGELAFGGTWDDARPLVGIVTVGQLAFLSAIPAMDLVRVFGSPRDLVSTRLLTSGANVTVVIVGGALFGLGVVWATSTLHCVAALVWWTRARRVTDRRGRSPRPRPDSAELADVRPTVLSRLVPITPEP